MTLYKQITLMVLTIISLILATIMGINFTTSKEYMEDELSKSTVNNLLAISNRVSQTKGEKIFIEGIINSEFDSGYYKSIKFISNKNNWSYERLCTNRDKKVPKWFIDYINIRSKTLQKDIFLDWDMIGEISIELDLSTLHETLYKTFIYFLYIFIASFFLSSLVFSILLRVMLKPLRDVQKQADAILHHKYIIQKDIPKIAELRDVVISMNTMVQKIEFMFNSVNSQLREQKIQSYTDRLTKLKTREYLVDKLPEYLKLDAQIQTGVNIIISISGMIETNRKIGRKKADDFYIEIANIFRDVAKESDDAIVARLNGTEFNILMPNYSINTIKDKIILIQKRAKEIIEKYNIDSSILYLSFGVYEYNLSNTPNELLSITDSALQKAKNSYSHIYYQGVTNKFELKGKDQWRELIQHSLTKDSFSFTTSSVIDTQAKKILHNIINIVMLTPKRKYKYEEFMPIAIELGLSSKIYSQIISNTIIYKKEALSSINILQLHYEYLQTKESYYNIKKLCGEFLSNNKYSLTVEISDKFIRKNPILMEAYMKLLNANCISLGIFEFIGEGENYEYLRKLNPDYIKMNATFLLSRTSGELLSIQTLMKTLNIIPIATEVEDEDTFNTLKALEIYTMQGEYIKV